MTRPSNLYIRYSMYTITYALLLLWGIAFLERLYSMVTSERASSVWSLLFVGGMLCLHLTLLYTERISICSP